MGQLGGIRPGWIHGLKKGAHFPQFVNSIRARKPGFFSPFPSPSRQTPLKGPMKSVFYQTLFLGAVILIGMN